MNSYTIKQISDALSENADKNLCFSEEDRQRVLTNPYLAKKLEMLKKAGDELRNTPICELRYSAFRRYYDDGNRTEFESAKDGYFIRRRRLVIFSILSWLYGKKEDLDALSDILWAICSEYTWSLPAHIARTDDGFAVFQTDGTYQIDLFSSETAAGIAETLSLVGDKLEKPVVMRCEKELHRRIFSRALDDFGWKHSTNNWVGVCNGGCGIAALYCAKDPELRAKIVTECATHITNYCKSITDEGATSEGLGYWAYGMGFYIYFAELLHRATGGDIDLLNNDKIRASASFFCDSVFPKGQYVSFADMWGKTIFYALPGLLCKIKELYSEVTLRGYELMDFSFPEILRLRFTREIREFVWVATNIKELIEENYPTRIMPAAEVYISTSKNNISIAAKAGHNDEHHNHNDVGSFILIKDGVRIVDDIGASEYTSDYFPVETRYKHFATSSFSHNLPIIDSKPQMPGKECNGRNVSINENGISADISPAYANPHIKKLLRSISFDRACGKTVLRDEFELEKPLSITERFVTPHLPTVSDGKITFGADGKYMTATYDKELFDVKLSSQVDIRHDIHLERTTYIVDLVAKEKATSLSAEILFE